MRLLSNTFYVIESQFFFPVFNLVLCLHISLHRGGKKHLFGKNKIFMCTLQSLDLVFLKKAKNINNVFIKNGIIMGYHFQ